MFKIIDKSKEHLFNEFKDLVNNFMHYAIKRLKITEPIRIYLTSDLKNAKNPLGKTAYYDDRNRVIILFTDNRHIKDILRSLSHELVHHAQACRGEFDNPHDTSLGYAQRDPHLRQMEKEAYLKGNIYFRDFEDKEKQKTSYNVD
jgi:hypothetical protein